MPFRLSKGANAIRWLQPNQPIANAPFYPLIEVVYTPNPFTGEGFISYQPGDELNNMYGFGQGYDYLIIMREPYDLPDGTATGSNAFVSIGFPATMPDTAPTVPVGRTEMGVAAEPIMGGRLVAQTSDGLRLYSCDNPDYMHLLFGIALNSALTGGSVSVRRPGFVRFQGWGLPAGVLLLAGLEGKLTTSVSPPCFLHVIGRSLTGDELIYQPEIPALIVTPQSTT